MAACPVVADSRTLEEEHADIGQLLAEAKALHQRVTSILTNRPNVPSILDHRPGGTSIFDHCPNAPSISHRQPFLDEQRPITVDHRDRYASSHSLEELLRRGRNLDERVKRLRLDLPSPRPLRQRQERQEERISSAEKAVGDAEVGEENAAANGAARKDVSPLCRKDYCPLKSTASSEEHDNLADRERRPSSAPVARVMTDDELARPTVRPVLRLEPGLPSYKHDPVQRYELYKKQWAKFPPPGEKKHSALRWKVREYMLRVDLPSDLNSRGRFPFKTT